MYNGEWYEKKLDSRNNRYEKYKFGRSTVQDEALNTIYAAIGSARWTAYTNERGEVERIIWSDELRRLLGYTDELQLPNTMQVAERAHSSGGFGTCDAKI